LRCSEENFGRWEVGVRRRGEEEKRRRGKDEEMRRLTANY
jgi:hypothetical protein